MTASSETATEAAMGLLDFLFGSGRRSDDRSSKGDEKGWIHPRDETDHDEWENEQRWLEERSKDP